MAPDVTVIVPFFGEATTGLGRLLASLARQAFPGTIETIVVDNNAMPLKAEVPANVRLLHEPAPGSYAARNAGLRAARGRVIAFTDSDCECAPGWLAAGVAALARDPGTGIVGGAVTSRPSIPGAPGLAERYDAFFHMRQRHYVESMRFAATANCFVRRELFDAIGPFAAGLRSGGDREWCARAVAAGHRIAYEPQAVVMHDAREMTALILKARRLAGQEWSHARAAGRGAARAAKSELAFYVRRVRRLLDTREEIERADRAVFFGIATTLQAVRFAELARLSLLRGEPERR